MPGRTARESLSVRHLARLGRTCPELGYAAFRGLASSSDRNERAVAAASLAQLLPDSRTHWEIAAALCTDSDVGVAAAATGALSNFWECEQSEVSAIVESTIQISPQD